MKKILAIAYITLLSFTAFAQNYNQNVNFTRTTLLSGKTMVQDTSLYIKSGNDTIRVTNYGDTSRFSTTAAAWKFTPALPSSTAGNGLTKVGDAIQLGGMLNQSTTIFTDTNDIVFSDTINNINFGIKNALTGNRAFIAEHIDSVYINLLVNKLEQQAGLFTNNFDINGSVVFNQNTGEISGNYTAVDNVTGEVFAGMTYISNADTYEVRLDTSGLRIKFANNPAFTFKPSGIVNFPLPTYASDALAGAAGLVAGDLYQTVTAGEGFVKIKQ